MRKKSLKKLNNRCGSTMIEVLVAIIVVMLMMGVLAGAMTTVMDLWNRSHNRLQDSITVDTQYYKSASDQGIREKEAVRFTLVPEEDGKNADPQIAIYHVEKHTFRMDEGNRFDLRLKE